MQLYQTSSHDLVSDAFFIKHDRLMFASLYGRDANMLSLFGLLSGSGEQVDALGFRPPESNRLYPENTTARHFRDLQKRMTKLHTHNYGVLTHVFLFAEDLIDVDRAGRSAWVVSDDASADMGKMVWSAVTELADVPLLDEWSGVLLDLLATQQCLTAYRPGINAEAAVVGIQACQIRLPDDFDRQVSDMLKAGTIGH